VPPRFAGVTLRGQLHAGYGVDDLIGAHSTIDRADDILRRHRAEPSARAGRRKLARLDQAQLIEDWVELIGLVDAATVQPD
jgi:hypothetical protein